MYGPCLSDIAYLWYQSWKLYLYVLNPDPSLVCFPPDTPAQADPVSYDSLGL